MEPAPFSSSYDAASATLHVHGDVEGPALSQLRGALATYCYESDRDLVVDLTGATYLPSAAIGVMTVALKTADVVGCSLEFVIEQDSLVHRTLEICGMPHRVT